MKGFAEKFQQYSVDEAFLVPGPEIKSFEEAVLCASKIKDGKSVLREEKCIGCGLCVTSCPEQARSLVKKSPDRLYTPPESLFEAYADMSAERSKREGIDP